MDISGSAVYILIFCSETVHSESINVSTNVPQILKFKVHIAKKRLL